MPSIFQYTIEWDSPCTFSVHIRNHLYFFIIDFWEATFVIVDITFEIFINIPIAYMRIRSTFIGSHFLNAAVLKPVPIAVHKDGDSHTAPIPSILAYKFKHSPRTTLIPTIEELKIGETQSLIHNFSLLGRRTKKQTRKMGSEGETVRKPRFLCLHGFRTSGEILKTQVGKWPESVLQKIDLVFLDAPFPCLGKSDVEGIFDPPYYEWFQFNKVSLSFFFFALIFLFIVLFSKLWIFGNFETVLFFS